MPEESTERQMGRRAFWSGSITFGLVSIPVALVAGHRSRPVSLHLFDEEGNPLSRRYYCPREDRPVAPEEIVKGYEIQKGKFITVTDEELEALQPKKSREIDLRHFVPVEQIDPQFFERGYFLVPEGASGRPYRLLAETMEKTGRAGLATFVMRGREYLVAILAQDGLLRAETLRFADEVRSPENVGLPQPATPSAELIDSLAREIRAAAKDNLEETELQNSYAQKLLALAEKKRRAGELVRTETEMPDEAGEEDVVDLMEVLKKMMAEER